MKNDKVIILVSIVTFMLFISGFGLLLFSSYNIKNYVDKYNSYELVIGNVSNYVKKNNKYALVVSYTVNGNEYSKVSDIYKKNNLDIGEEVKLKYNVNDYEDSIWMPVYYIKTFLLLPLSVIFIIFSLIGIYYDYKLVKDNKKVNYIKSSNGFYDKEEYVIEVRD